MCGGGVKRMDNEGEDERRSHVSGREIVKGELQQEQVSSERAGPTSWWGEGVGKGTLTNTGTPPRVTCIFIFNSFLHESASAFVSSTGWFPLFLSFYLGVKLPHISGHLST